MALSAPAPTNVVPTSSTSSSDKWVVIGLAVGIFMSLVIALTATLIACLLWRRTQRHYHKPRTASVDRSIQRHEEYTSSRDAREPSNSFDIQKVLNFRLKELTEATNNFSLVNHLGQGSYGTVYKAKLRSGEMVAVKRAKPDRKQDITKFRKEIELLSRVSHKNLVRLVGYCKEGGEQLLVYEYVAGGNLSQNLNRQWRARQSRPPLNWTERLLIAAGTARGLAYLHEEINMPFIHRDVKASNIMIDRHVVAKLADFGTSKLMTGDELRKMSATIQGTAGYCDPDYLQSGKPSKRIDVYSFGIVLLELITGEGPHRISKPYRYYVKDKFEKHGLDNLVDESMGLYPEDELRRILDLGFRCTEVQDPASRPSMNRVITEIESVLEPETVIRLQKGGSHGYDSQHPSSSPPFSVVAHSGKITNEGTSGEVVVSTGDLTDPTSYDRSGIHSYGDVAPA